QSPAGCCLHRTKCSSILPYVFPLFQMSFTRQSQPRLRRAGPVVSPVYHRVPARIVGLLGPVVNAAAIHGCLAATAAAIILDGAGIYNLPLHLIEIDAAVGHIAEARLADDKIFLLHPWGSSSPTGLWGWLYTLAG